MVLPVLIPSPVPIQPATLVAIDRKETYAGRLGRRVAETWTVEANGSLRTLKVAPYHTQVRRTPRFVAGDLVWIPSSAARLTLGQVRRAR